ncbi:GntR family transcriptional regulator [Rhodobacteraceae bacterium M385]|nr:GntR family transcriptional regulator [Rhodobacteraceae bacterium M385]
MNTPSFRNWQSVQDEALRRIHAREWAPGELIPNEADLAEEFGCARSTVNRALRALAESGILDRKRKAGTRVAAQPAARATLTIPVLRHEIEDRGEVYGYQLAYRALQVPPISASAAMGTSATQQLLHVRALHLASGTPYAMEDRWINTEVAPKALDEDFREISANEWLLHHVPYTHGDIAFSAVAAPDDVAEALLCAAGEAVFAMDRVTWDGTSSVTKVRLLFAPGYQMRTAL